MKKKEVKDLGNRQGTAVQQKGNIDCNSIALKRKNRQLSERLDIRLSASPPQLLFFEDYIQQISQFAVEQENTTSEYVYLLYDQWKNLANRTA